MKSKNIQQTSEYNKKEADSQIYIREQLAVTVRKRDAARAT